MVLTPRGSVHWERGFQLCILQIIDIPLTRRDDRTRVPCIHQEGLDIVRVAKPPGGRREAEGVHQARNGVAFVPRDAYQQAARDDARSLNLPCFRQLHTHTRGLCV